LVLPWTAARGINHQSHVLEHIDTYGQVQICSKGHQGSSVDRDVSRLFVGSSSGMYGFWYLRVFDNFSGSWCATGPAKESEVYPKRPQVGKKTNAHITPIRPLPVDSAPLVCEDTTPTTLPRICKRIRMKECVCFFVLLTRGRGRLETRLPVQSCPGIFSTTLRFYYSPAL